jgi:hypothetical protein
VSIDDLVAELEHDDTWPCSSLLAKAARRLRP